VKFYVVAGRFDLEDGEDFLAIRVLLAEANLDLSLEWTISAVRNDVFCRLWRWVRLLGVA